MILIEGSADGKEARKVGDVSVAEAANRATEAIVNLAIKYLNEVRFAFRFKAPPAANELPASQPAAASAATTHS